MLADHPEQSDYSVGQGSSFIEPAAAAQSSNWNLGTYEPTWHVLRIGVSPGGDCGTVRLAVAHPAAIVCACQASGIRPWVPPRGTRCVAGRASGYRRLQFDVARRRRHRER